MVAISARGRTHARRARAAAGACGIAFAVFACDASAPLIVETTEPVFAMVLAPPGSAPDTLVDPRQRALIATTGRPTAVTFRRVEVFELRRARDQALFAWSEDPAAMPAGVQSLFSPFIGNYVMTDESATGRLGRADLVPGERYTLRVVTEGRVITGVVTIPERPRIVLTREGDRWRVSWSRVPGVPFYIVLGADAGPVNTTTDTTALVQRDLGGDAGVTDRVKVIAVDANYGRYLRDSSVTAAGIQGAYGVMGAISAAEVLVPRP